jgi:endonuclease/exonuclease/phosphatase family metal-dependent hydrolase
VSRTGGPDDPVSRDPSVLEECRALQKELERIRTHRELRAPGAWDVLGPRFERLLGGVRLHAPSAPPPSTVTPDRVVAVHWNIEHGNRYAEIEQALLENPQLKDADIHFFNEIDLGMARAGNRDVLGDLSRTLCRYGAWSAMFLETTIGRDDDAVTAGAAANQESLFGVGLLSRWPIGSVRLAPLPSPEEIQFDLERMVGRHVLLAAEILRPEGPFVAATAHLEVHRTRRHRAEQIRVVTDVLRDETRPVILAGDFNTHTFDRGLWHSPIEAGRVLMTSPAARLRRRLLHPDRGAHHEPLFDLLRDAGFAWEPYVDHRPTLQLRFDRVDEARAWDWLARLASPLVRWATQRGALRLDWMAGRGWRNAGDPPGSHGRTIAGLDGPGRASDHAPIRAEFA